MDKGATMSKCGRYRYRLWRVWNYKKPGLCWILLNPSTADAQSDDPTIRRCINFAASWGYGGIHVVNLFALRATDPREISKVEEPVGPGNDEVILSYAYWPIIAGWGSHGSLLDRDHKVIDMLSGSNIQCLGFTKDGHPRHPLYIAKDKQLQKYERR